MSPEVPHEEKEKLESKLYSTIDVQTRILAFSPQMLAATLGRDSRIPNAWAVLEHTANAVQAARYHLYMALYERLFNSQFRDPRDPSTGDVLADFLFTSFSLHAIAAESHLAVSIARLFDFPVVKRGGPEAPSARNVLRQLESQQEAEPFTGILEPFRSNETWNWLRKFRNRWTHMNPVRVKELGIQHDMDSKRTSFWKQHPSSGTWTIGIGGGDSPEITIQEMLEKGISCFNLLGKQLDSYTGHMEAKVEIARQERLA